MFSGLLGRVEIPAPFSWFILDIQHRRLVESWEGNIDVLAGRLEWLDPTGFEAELSRVRQEYPESAGTIDQIVAAGNLARAGGLKWPPSSDYLVGIEAKCAYLSPEVEGVSPDAMKSTKSSRAKVERLRRQIDCLLNMGMDKVVLLDIIANPPVSGPDGGAWVFANQVAHVSKEAMATVFANRLHPDSPSGHWVVSLGSVVGGNESMRGAYTQQVLRNAEANPRLSDNSVRKRRQELSEKLRILLGSIPRPQAFPVVLMDCGDCSNVHSTNALCYFISGTQY